MKIALYKGRHRIFNIITSWWLSGKYSHCEVVFSDGICASSSFLDKGVRFKHIDLNPEHWDIIEVDADETKVRKWFLANENVKYDTLGLIGFLLRPIKGSSNRVVCSEAIMAALGYEEAWRFDPCMLRPILEKTSG